MSKIYDLTLKYRIVKKTVIWSFKNYYSEHIVVGIENLPKSGPILFAPNHRNALMDALAVHSIKTKHYSTSFLARSDIFKNKTLAKFLRAAKIMPAFRSRDGIENLGKNAAIFEQCIELLLQKHALCIMPEGNQALDKKIRPLVKGIFRIALSTQEQLPNEAVNIVAIGIDYGDITKARKHIIINIAKPIDVREYMSLYNDNQPVAINELRAKLSDELQKLTVNINSRENYDSFEAVIEIIEKPFLETMGLKDSTINRFEAQREIASKLVEIEKTDQVKTESIVSKSNLCIEHLKSLKLKPAVLNSKAPKLIKLLLDGMLLVTTTPVFALGLLLNFIPFFLPVYIRKHILKPKFSGFFSSIQFVIGLISFPLFYGIQTALLATFTMLPFGAILLFIPFQWVVGKCALVWYRLCVKHLARIRYYKLNVHKSEILFEANKLQKELLEEIIK